MSKSNLIRQYYRDYPEYRDYPTKLAEIMLQNNPELGETTNLATLRSSISAMKTKGIIESPIEDDIEISVEDHTKWEVVNDHYQWKSSKGSINMPVEFIDQLFFEYSEHGLNLSQTKIMNKHDLKPWQWHSIKGTLMLYKQSHVFSPYTVDNTPPEEMQEMVAKKVGKVFSSVGYQVEDQYNKQLRTEYKKVIQKQTTVDLIHQTIVTELQDFFDSIPKSQRVIALPQNKETTIKATSAAIFDIHYGAESRSKDLPAFSPEILDEMFSEIAREINNRNAEEVHLFFGGDNIETFTGLNHPDSWKGIAKGYYGAEVVKRGYKAITKFIQQVNNVKKIHAVPGNHDRATESAAVDGEGYIAELLFELIKLSLGENIEVNYHNRIISETVDGLQILMSHGHKKVTNINPAELILQYGNPELFNVLISGHWHNRKVSKDHRQFRQLVCPSLFAGNDYSADLGVGALSGFLLIENNGKGKPKVIDYPL